MHTTFNIGLLYNYIKLPNYKLDDWIDKDLLVTYKEYFVFNSRAIDIFNNTNHPYHSYLCNNENFQYTNKQILDWYYISGNPNTMSIIKNNLDKIHWNILSENPSAIKLLKKNLNKIN